MELGYVKKPRAISGPLELLDDVNRFCRIIKKLGAKGILELRDSIKFEDIEKLLRKKKEEMESGHMVVGPVYPTIRWNFDYDDYIVVGVPDGIADSFVYEFKTTGSYFLLKYVKPVAFSQADLYGYFFRRREKRVQILVKENLKKETWNEEVDTRNALETLKNFREVERKERDTRASKIWKCKKCEFKSSCSLKNNLFLSLSELIRNIRRYTNI